MPVSEIVLHVGAYKTGSTTLQMIANRNRAGLSAAGILWPETGLRENRGALNPMSKAHHLLFHAADGRPRYVERLPEFERGLQREFEETDCCKALISTELLSSGNSTKTHEPFLRLLGWPGRKVRIEFCVRLPDEYVESTRSQVLKNKGVHVSGLDIPFGRVAQSFIDLVGRDNVRLRYFNKRSAETTFESFFSDLGASGVVSPEDYSLRENDSLSLEGYAIRQRIFRRFKITSKKNRAVLLLRLAEIEQRLESKRKLVLLSPEERWRIREQHATDMQHLARLLPPIEAERFLTDLEAPVSQAQPNIGEAQFPANEEALALVAEYRRKEIAARLRAVFDPRKW